MAKDKKDVPSFNADESLELSIAKAKLCAARGIRKAKAGGGIAAAASALAKDLSEAFGEGGEHGVRRSYLAVSCTSKALAEQGEGVFDLIDREHGASLSPQEKRALYEEVKLLVDDRLDPVIMAALTLGEFHLEPQNVGAFVKELKKTEPISTSMGLFGPSAMAQVKPKARVKVK